MLDFLSYAVQHDKQLFKEFIEKETQFKYSERLFLIELDSGSSETNIVNFTKIVNGKEDIRQSFLSFKRTMCLFERINKQNKNKAAKRVKNFKRCVFNIEEN